MFLHRKRKEEIKKKKKNQAIKRLGRLRRVGRRSLSAAAGEKSNSQERMTHFASARFTLITGPPQLRWHYWRQRWRRLVSSVRGGDVNGSVQRLHSKQTHKTRSRLLVGGSLDPATACPPCTSTYCLGSRARSESEREINKNSQCRRSRPQRDARAALFKLSHH